MTIAITGAGGMLGQALSPCLEGRGHKTIDLPKEDLDITNYALVQKTITGIKNLDLVIHCAAYTKVDQAESEAGLAYLINGYGTENLAVVCNKLDVPILYISTDYVFDGEQNKPYTPWDATNPLSIYGKSKLAGEIAVQRHLSKFYIVRTSWLYGPHGKNFVETIINLAEQKKPLRIVSDQIGSPTCTLSLSEIIADLIATERFGVYHASDDGIASWYDFACAIVHNQNIQVTPIETKDMPRPATRPKYSVLDKTSLISTIGRELPSWQNSLNTYLQLRALRQPVVRSVK